MIDTSKVPMLPGKVLTKKINVAVDEETKALWSELKDKGVDVPEVTRRFLKDELPKLKEKVA